MPSSRQSAHVAVALMSWLLMIVMWGLLFRNSSATTHALFSAAENIGVMAATVSVITVLWVRHNL